jgi:hypothetical protein
VSRYSDRLRAARPGFNSRQKQAIFSLSYSAKNGFGPYQASSAMNFGCWFSWLKRPEHKADISHQSDVHVKNYRVVFKTQGQFYLFKLHVGIRSLLHVITEGLDSCFLLSSVMYKRNSLVSYRGPNRERLKAWNLLRTANTYFASIAACPLGATLILITNLLFLITRRCIPWNGNHHTVCCLLYASLYFIILGTYFIVLGMYYCMFIVLGTYYCMFAVAYVLL